ncbi:hypothetical protein Tco_0996833 [Tanacetum coccineum]
MGHNYVPNGLVDSLYNVCYKTMTAKELWESLECKYKTEDVGFAPELVKKETSYVYGRCFEAFRNLMCHNYALYGPNDMKTETMRDPTLDNGGLTLRLSSRGSVRQCTSSDGDNAAPCLPRGLAVLDWLVLAS